METAVRFAQAHVQMTADMKTTRYNVLSATYKDVSSDHLLDLLSAFKQVVILFLISNTIRMIRLANVSLATR